MELKITLGVGLVVPEDGDACFAFEKDYVVAVDFDPAIEGSIFKKKFLLLGILLEDHTLDVQFQVHVGHVSAIRTHYGYLGLAGQNVLKVPIQILFLNETQIN
jgi:hypothetical protein